MRGILREGSFLLRPLNLLVMAAALTLLPGPGAADEVDSLPDAAREVARVRNGLGFAREALEDLSTTRTSYGRPAVEVEGWRRLEEGGRWPVDQATFDVRSGLLSKYVNFDNASRRQAGEAILPMGTVSARADGFLAVLYPRDELALEGIERYRVKGKESVYYELSYSPQPLEVSFLRPLVRILVNASTGSLYRYELAADHLGAGAMPSAKIGSLSAGRIASLFLQQALAEGRLQGEIAGEIAVADLYYLRPNGWLEAEVPAGGEARAAWVIQFTTTADGAGAPPSLLFVDALTGRILGGIGQSSPQ